MITQQNLVTGVETKEEERVTWTDVLQQMEDGTFRLPAHIQGRFRWLTSPLLFDDDTSRIRGTFRQDLIRDHALDVIQSNPAQFSAHLTQVNKKDVSATFPNLDGSCTLVVPVVHTHHDYSTLYDFVRHASNSVQIQFWRDVSGAIQRLAFRHPNERIWVSTHGLGVPYLHIRICKQPKYYPSGHPLTEYTD